MISAGLERMSNHPYAATIINEANLRELSKPSEISEISDGEAGVDWDYRRSEDNVGRAGLADFRGNRIRRGFSRP